MTQRKTASALPMHMNGRIYDPLLGRFLSADKKIDGITSLQGWNRYSYVANNPLSFHDPDGYQKARKYTKIQRAMKAKAANSTGGLIVRGTVEVGIGFVPWAGDAYGTVVDVKDVATGDAVDKAIGGTSLAINTWTAGAAPNLGPIKNGGKSIWKGIRKAFGKSDAPNVKKVEGENVGTPDTEDVGDIANTQSSGVDAETRATPEGYPGEGMDGMNNDHAVPQSLDKENPALQDPENMQQMGAAMNQVDKSFYDKELIQRFRQLSDDLQAADPDMSASEARLRAYVAMEDEIKAHANSLPARAMDPNEIDNLEQR